MQNEIPRYTELERFTNPVYKSIMHFANTEHNSQK